MFFKSLFSSSPVSSFFGSFTKAPTVSLPIVDSAVNVVSTFAENIVVAPTTAVTSAQTVVNNAVNLVTQNPVNTVLDNVATMISGPAVIQEGVGTVLQGVHAVAEGVLATTGLQPIFSLIDEPIIHPLLWTPLAALTGVPVDQHPAELTSATGLLDQMLVGPVVIQHGVGTVLQGLHGTAEGALATAGLQPIFSVIDEPVIHPLFWEPLGVLTDAPVATHPDSLAVATNATLPNIFDDVLLAVTPVIAA